MMVLSALRLPRSRPDVIFLGAAVAILALGLIMVASASVAVAERATGEPLYYFYRQAIYALIGLSAGFAVLHIPLSRIRDNSFALLAGALVLLFIVLLPGIGSSVNGAQRWIDLGIFNVQVSEPARLLLLLYLAGYATRRQVELRTTFNGLVRPILPLTLACLLLLMEPDFGGTVVLVAVAGMMLFLAGARMLHMLILGGGAIFVLVVAAVSEVYRKARLTGFIDPWADPFGSGFQLTQSLIAIGRGEMMGVGLGNSVQKLMYLPFPYTDFMFAVYAEEFGLFGSLLLVSLFALIVWRGFVIARRAVAAELLFGAFVAYGLSSWIALQGFLNMGVNMGLLPTKGLTLPLMSYGGSSLVVMCVVIALLIRVDLEATIECKRKGVAIP